MAEFDRRQQLNFANVKTFATRREKCLQFELPNGLEGAEELRPALAELRRQGWQRLPRHQSQLWREGGSASEPVSPSHDSFWTIVYSDFWEHHQSLRLCEGELLQTLLRNLHLLTESNAVDVYKTARFDKIFLPRAKSILKPTGAVSVKQQPVKITFTYYSVASENSKQQPTHRMDVYGSVSSLAIKTSASKYSKESSGDSSVTNSAGSLHSCPSSLQEGSPVRTYEEQAKVWASVEAMDSDETSASLLMEGTDNVEKNVVEGGSNYQYQELNDTEASLMNAARNRLDSKLMSCNAIYLAFPAKKNLPPPEVVHLAVTFDFVDDSENKDDESARSIVPVAEEESDYLEEKLEPVASKQPLLPRPYLTDKHEHVIGDRTYNKEGTMKYETRADSKSLNSYLRYQQRKKTKNVLHKTGTSQKQSTFRNNENRRNTVYFHMIEHNSTQRSDSKAESDILKRKCSIKGNSRETMKDGDTYPKSQKGSMMKRNSDTMSSNGSTAELPPLIKAINERKNARPFIKLNTQRLRRAYSIERMHRIERHHKIRDSIPLPTAHRQYLQTKLEVFLKDKFLPRIEESGAPPKMIRHKLYPKAFLTPQPAGTLEPLLPHGCGLEPLPIIFPGEVADEVWRHWLLKCMQDFVFRKEQITFADSWKTITSVTISRRHIT